MPLAYGGKTYGNVTSPWVTLSYFVNCFCKFDGPGDNDEIFIGDLEGNIYELNVGYAEETLLVSKDFNAPDPFEEILIKEAYMIARSNDVGAGRLFMQFMVDQVLNTNITLGFPASGDLTSTYQLYYVPLIGTEDTIQGSKIGVKVWPEKDSMHYAIQAIKLIGEIVPIEKGRVE